MIDSPHPTGVMLGISRLPGGLVTPYARNSIDGTRVYFDHDGGRGAPVVFYGGLVDSVEAVRLSPIAQALPAGRFRLVYVDHRGVGRSDKPHEPAASAMRLRVADAVSVLDAMGIRRATPTRIRDCPDFR
jgi:pimeloyl-ACP methyl ester carboxylesterase